MKALILSLVIAFSSSFALANCPLADASFNSNEGKLTRSMKPAPVRQNNVRPQHVVYGGQTK